MLYHHGKKGQLGQSTYRLGYLKAVSTGCWQTISTSEVFSSYVLSSLTIADVLKSNLITISS